MGRIHDLLVLDDAFVMTDSTADLCSLATLEKRWEDVDVPGPVLAGGACAWVEAPSSRS